MTNELIILRDLTDEEIIKLTDTEIDDMISSYKENGIPERATVKGLLKEYNVKYDDLTEFILGLEVCRCNHVNRSENQIYINRPNSNFKDNIVINLDEQRDIPDVTIQIQINDDFIHEEGYNKDGLEIYRS